MSSPGKQRTSTVKVGVLTVFSLGLLFFALIWLRGKGLGSGNQYHADFGDANGLREGAAVQMMGIRVGFVDSVEPRIVEEKDPKTNELIAKRYKVRISFTINDDFKLKIPNGSRLSLEQSGLIGDLFLEITPPRLQEITVQAPPTLAGLSGEIPVKILYDSGLKSVGKVENLRPYIEDNKPKYQIFYRLTQSGASMPIETQYSLAIDADHHAFLELQPKDPGDLAQAPQSDDKFTVEDPMRMKRFLEIQMESAEALKLTNNKINQLMSDSTINSLQHTLKNAEVLTARASEVMESANTLFKTTRSDLTQLVDVSKQLATNVSSVSANINEVIGDPNLRKEMNDTVSSLHDSSVSIHELLNDPALKETIQNTRETSQNAAELVNSLRQTMGPDTQQRVEHIVTQLDTSLNKLNNVLNTVDKSVDGKDDRLNGIMKDTRESAKNLRQLTGKFNGHFTLFKLLF